MTANYVKDSICLPNSDTKDSCISNQENEMPPFYLVTKIEKGYGDTFENVDGFLGLAPSSSEG